MISIDPDTQFAAEYVPHGTPYFDEPSETIPAGWYVMGRHPECDLDDPDAAPIVISIEQALDSDGKDIERGVALEVAKLLNDHFADPA